MLQKIHLGLPMLRYSFLSGAIAIPLYLTFAQTAIANYLATRACPECDRQFRLDNAIF
ncbi:MAG: hypothetical protein WCQ26_12075 [Pseudanabaena sp. ELA748]